MTWKQKLWDSLIDRNVFYTMVFLGSIVGFVPPDKRDIALIGLATLAFAGGTTKTVMNGLKAKALIQAQGGGSNGQEGQG